MHTLGIMSFLRHMSSVIPDTLIPSRAFVVITYIAFCLSTTVIHIAIPSQVSMAIL
jgi:hypothetical protein